jgi:TetR/AcrR family transcriptional regulator, cholesterol catabolism regulator
MAKTALAPADPVLDAAARLFRRKGFAATTVREIAAEAGILPGSLHYRYATKEEILVALMERGIRAALDSVQAAVQESHDPIERLRLGLRAHLKGLLADSDSVHVVLFEWRSVTGSARDAVMRLRDGYEAFWDGLLYEALGTGRARQMSDVRLVRLFGFGAINWVSTWYRPGAGLTPEQIADAFWAFMAFGLLSDDARGPGVDALFASLTLPVKAPAPKRARGRRTDVSA